MAPSDRELYRTIDRSPIGAFRCDRRGELVRGNAALARLLGCASAAELCSRDLALAPDDLARLFARAEAGDPRGVRARWRSRDGALRVVELHAHAAERPEPAATPGAPLDDTVDISVVDVTALDRAHDELDRQREALTTGATLLDLVVSQMTAIYWRVDRELRVQSSGGAIRDLLGTPPGRFRGMTLAEMQAIEPSSVDPVVMHRRAINGETVHYAHVFRDKHLLTTLCPHRVAGEIVGAIGTCIDVTTHHVLERRMVDAQRAETLGVLAGGVAHDLNNLLSAIIGNVEVALRERGPRAAGHAPLENIRQASLRAGELIELLLAYAGHGAAVTTRVSASHVLDELLRISAPTLPANVVVQTDVTRDLVIRGDATQIRQVLLNLIGNARDALGGRGGTIAISGGHDHHDGEHHPDDIVTAAPGHYVALTVSDDGPGIEPALRRRIFEPFFTTKPTGHGLGLATVLGVVRGHGGGLRVSSAPGDGARFELRWPSAAAPGARPDSSPPGGSHTVLVIDDEDRVRDVTARMIEELGYAAITATDAPSGLAIVDSVPIDAVLIDLPAPRSPGVDVVTELRSRRPGMPIILCSARDRGGPAIPADAFLAKPFQLDTLDQTLAKLLPG